MGFELLEQFAEHFFHGPVGGGFDGVVLGDEVGVGLELFHPVGDFGGVLDPAFLEHLVQGDGFLGLFLGHIMRRVRFLRVGRGVRPSFL